ncbi:MAG: hypothetical protein NTY42_00025, partial [Planctomycetota bacterium]|nr:hypothetical protein [Planctomycetota bacterium]
IKWRQRIKGKGFHKRQSEQDRTNRSLNALSFYYTGMFAWERTRPPKPMDSVRITAFLLNEKQRRESCEPFGPLIVFSS